ncbi:cytochrome B561, N terminal-domain-containing protein [Syncephalis fuscata]|nr:cytochrome B561, N terminal-domain-containing protein [Syncephalis fuscata]
MDVPDLLSTSRIYHSRPSKTNYTSARSAHVATTTPNTSFIFGPAPIATAAHTSTATVADTDTPIGHWEHPAIKLLDQQRRSNETLLATRRRFRINVAFLLLFIAITNLGYYRSVIGFIGWVIPGLGNLFSYAEWLVYLVFGVNITDAWIRWTKPNSAYASLPLTQYQRRLLGLPELVDVKSPKEGTEMMAAPRYQPIVNSLRQSVSTTPAGPSRRYPATTTPFGTTPRGIMGMTTTPLNSPPPRSMLFGNNHGYLRERQNRSTFGDISGQPLTEASEIDALIDANEPTLNMSMLSQSGIMDRSGASTLHLSALSPGNGQGLSTNYGQPPIPTFAYQEALPITKRNLATATVERALDGLGYKDPQTVLDELGVDLYIDTWTENLRMWLSSRVLRSIVQLVNEVDQELSQQGLAHLDSSKCQLPLNEYPAIAMALEPNKPAPATTATSGLIKPFGFGQTGTAFGASTNLQPQPSQIPQTLVELVQRYPQMPLVRKRIELERYLNIPGYTCRDYIIARIKDLAVGGVLAAYRWDSGAIIWNDDKKWTPEMPSDAQLILHLFCTFLDMVTPDNDVTFPMNVPFSSLHYLAEGTKPDPNVAIQLKQVKKHPPHYCLVVDNKYWDVYPKRSNLFHTLVLFTFYANTRCAGYLGLLKLSSKAVGLSEVVAE